MLKCPFPMELFDCQAAYMIKSNKPIDHRCHSMLGTVHAYGIDKRLATCVCMCVPVMTGSGIMSEVRYNKT